MKNIIDNLKILTGRKLSEKEIKSNILNKEDRRDTFWSGLYREGDQIIKREVLTQYATTPDISHGWAIPHTGDYFVGANIRNYNKDGLLIRKEITRNEPMSPIHKDKIIVYDKPGQFIGKRNDRYNYLIEVVKLDRNNLCIIESNPESKVSSSWFGGIKHRVSHISSDSNKPIKEAKFRVY